jgi:hypothetical protein
MKNIVLLTFIAFSFLMSSCARKPGKKLDMSFVLGASFDSAGGAMLYGKNLSNGEEFGDSVTIEAPFEKYLSFGQWKFWVVAWPGDPSTGSDMTGLARCDFKAVDLQPVGNTPEVVFNLNNSNCNSNEFSPDRSVFTGAGATKTYNMFPLFDFRTCLNLNDTNSFSEGCTLADGELGPFLSYKIILENHENGVPFGPAYESACLMSVFGAPDQDISEFAKVNIPLGSPDFPIRTVVRAYYGSKDCDQNNDGFGGANGPALGFKEIIFPRGLHQPAPGTKVFTDNSNSYCPVDYGLSPSDATCATSAKACEGIAIDGVLSSSCTSLDINATEITFDTGVYNTHTRYRIATESTVTDICQGFRISETFAAGNGADKPYMICTPTQFNNIGDTFLTSNFYLMADLNMNLSDEAQINQNCGFWPVSNTIPVGGIASDPGTCGTFYDGLTVLPYTGLFHGRGHWIMNARSEFEDLVKFGLFRALSSSAVVTGINFSNLEMRGKSNLGGVVGNLANSTLSNINIYTLDVKGRENAPDCKTGGVVGSASGSTMTNIHVYDGHVACKGNKLGGIIAVGGATLENVSFEGELEIDNNGPGSDIVDIGGIAGTLATTGSITKAYSKGSIDVDARNVGGIIGNLGAAVSISHVYSTMNINNHKYAEATGNALNTGGLVGSFTGDTVEFGIFAGAIQEKCNYTTLTDCKIGNTIGNNAGTTVLQILTSHAPVNKGGYDETASDYNTSLRSQSALSTMINNFNADTTAGCNIYQCWFHTDKDLPRLSFEDHECFSNLNQMDIFSQAGSLGRGSSEANPIYICNQVQLKAIGNDPNFLSKHYIVKDDILVEDFTADRIGIISTQFTGSFNGNDKTLYGFKMNITTPLEAKGMFNFLGPNGKISNVRLHGVDIYDETTSPLGALVGENQGTIFNSYIRGGKIVSGKQDGSTGTGTRVGSLVGKNLGIIEFSGGGLEMSARHIVGGIVGENAATGVISNSRSHSYIQPRWNFYGTFGGAVGINYGTIEKLTVHAKLDMRTYSPSTSTAIGAIVGSNMSTGKIFDSYSESDQIYISYPNNSFIGSNQSIGPIYGENSGQLKRVVSTTEVQFDAFSFGSCIDMGQPDVSTCGASGGFWDGVNCFMNSFFNNESSCTAASKQWYPYDGRYFTLNNIRGTTDTTNGVYHMIDPFVSLHDTQATACAVNGAFLELTLNNGAGYDLTQGNQKYVFLGRFEAKTSFNSMLTGPVRAKVSAAELGGDCTLVNSMMTQNGGSVDLKIVSIINQDFNSARSMAYMSEFNNFCTSATGLPDDPNYVCSGANDWDIVTDIDHPRNMGFNRLLNKYMNIMDGNISVLNQGPFWQMENGKPPRLITFD